MVHVLVLRIHLVVLRIHLVWDHPAVFVFMYVLVTDGHRVCAEAHDVLGMCCPLCALREPRLPGDALYQGALNML